MSEPVAFRGALHHWTLGEPPRLELVCVPTDNPIAQSIALLKGRELELAIYHKEEKLCTLAAALPPISTVVGKCGKATKVKLDVYPHDMASFLGAIRLADADGMMRFEFSPGGEVAAKQKREPRQPKEPTPYGKFWEAMDKAGFHNRPEIREVIAYFENDGDHAKNLWRNWLAVSSRANEASPDFVIERLRNLRSDDRRIEGAIKYIENLKASL